LIAMDLDPTLACAEDDAAGILELPGQLLEAHGVVAQEENNGDVITAAAKLLQAQLRDGRLIDDARHRSAGAGGFERLAARAALLQRGVGRVDDLVAHAWILSRGGSAGCAHSEAGRTHTALRRRGAADEKTRGARGSPGSARVVVPNAWRLLDLEQLE